MVGGPSLLRLTVLKNDNNMTKIIYSRPLAEPLPPELSSLHPVLQRIYAARGIKSVDDLDYSLRGLLPVSSLLHIDKAAEMLAQGIKDDKRLLIMGDFDADGATSSSVMVKALQMMGAKHVHFIVPNRFTYGYGLTPKLVDAAKSWQPDIIITVDNGIASHEGVDYAHSLGIKVIITDHHLPANTLPNADAIVNPNQPGCEFASKNLAGVGVAFYVMAALHQALLKMGWYEAQGMAVPVIANLLDLVALGTVADVVPLDKNNRILVEQGLKRIRAGSLRPGIEMLLRLAKRDPAHCVASDLAFGVAPRLNAAGRMDDMTVGIACLLSDDKERARALALELDELNQARRDVEQTMRSEAMTIVKQLELTNEMLPTGICLYQPDWHQGVIGIVAGRVKDHVHRPVVVFAKADDDKLKGSARSIPGLHIRDCLDRIATDEPDLIDKFGGHAMAAGLTIDEDKYSRFSNVFAETVCQMIASEDLRGEVLTDGKLVAADMTITLAETIRQADPWGQLFPEPLFEGRFVIHDQRVVGTKHLKLTLGFPDSSLRVAAIMFNVDVDEWPNYQCQAIHTAYYLRVNEYQGIRSVQLELVAIKAVASASNVHEMLHAD